MFLEYINDDVVLDINGEPVPPNVVWAEDKIAWLEENETKLSREERHELILQLTNEYLATFDERMPNNMLYRLGDIADVEYRTRKGRRPDDEENPSLSEHQLKRRRYGTKVNPKYRGREVSLRAAATVATDGNNYALPKRSFYNPD